MAYKPLTTIHRQPGSTTFGDVPLLVREPKKRLSIKDLPTSHYIAASYIRDVLFMAGNGLYSHFEVVRHCCEKSPNHSAELFTLLENLADKGFLKSPEIISITAEGRLLKGALERLEGRGPPLNQNEFAELRTVLSLHAELFKPSSNP